MQKSSGKLFYYDNLPDPKSYIRLLKIIGGPDDRDPLYPVQCIIRAWKLDDKITNFHAISYTWGDTARTKALGINKEGTSEMYALDVPQNGHEVLRQAWQYDKDAWYWIDSICINQNDAEEKGPQVSIMGEIYGTAQCVLACVGDHMDDSEDLYRFASLHASFLSSFWSGRRFGDTNSKKDSNESDWKSCYIPLHDRPLDELYSEAFRVVKALHLFLERPYFERLWIYQELCLARDVCICCGDDQVPIKLLDALALLYSDDHWLPPGRHRMPPAAHLLEVGATASAGVASTLWELLVQVHDMDLQCRDVRDKLFGLLAMANWKGYCPILPDYNISGFEVAKQVLMRLPREFPMQIDVWKEWGDKITRIFDVKGQFIFSEDGPIWMFVELSYDPSWSEGWKDQSKYLIELDYGTSNDEHGSRPQTAYFEILKSSLREVSCE